ncbi:MAG: flagellar FlbD family protein [Bacillota bacterium]|nr:flagellar FlbD family protein [Bacillota bacterium]
MINVTRLNGGRVVLNAELVELVEALPDTTVTLQNGHKYIVGETVDEVIERIIHYRRALHVTVPAGE